MASLSKGAAMMTLDEVIIGIKEQMGLGDPVLIDALHYLKAFRDAKDALEREKDRYAEAVKNCERAENIYKQKQKAAEDALWICKEDKDDLTALRAYWAEQQANPPLTWDELKQMEGKPVWVESHGDITEFTGWTIVRNALEDRVHFIFSHYDGEFLTYEMALPDVTFGKEWNVYRKERHER
jgi:hypothetical protein